jgi:hypothetical protein
MEVVSLFLPDLQVVIKQIRKQTLSAAATSVEVDSWDVDD